MSLSRRRGGSRTVDIWPSWVDALSSLLMVVIFVLMVFSVSQFYLSSALTGRDEALSRLQDQLAELADTLSVERRTNEELRSTIGDLTAQLDQMQDSADDLSTRLAAAIAERDRMREEAAAALARADASDDAAARAMAELARASDLVKTDRDALEMRLREIASLQADIKALREVRAALEAELGRLVQASQGSDAEVQRLTAALDESESARNQILAELSSERDRSKVLEAELASAEERTLLAQRDAEDKQIEIEELLTTLATTETALDEEKQLSSQAQAEVARMNQQLSELREQLARLNAALEASELKAAEQEAQIVDLGRRLNVALANKVEELARYRSEFFGRLREALGDRDDIRIEGDRFVFSSEVLFPTGSAQIQPAGQARLDQLAETLKDVASTIPSDINWILRVDGHTDIVPISTAQFPSNWELSTARAISVVKFLIDEGIPPERLVAAGFGEWQPLDPNDLSLNRRIEIKLDQR